MRRGADEIAKFDTSSIARPMAAAVSVDLGDVHAGVLGWRRTAPRDELVPNVIEIAVTRLRGIKRDAPPKLSTRVAKRTRHVHPRLTQRRMGTAI